MDFASVEWDAEPATDNLIHSLFAPEPRPCSKKKVAKKKKNKKEKQHDSLQEATYLKESIHQPEVFPPTTEKKKKHRKPKNKMSPSDKGKIRNPSSSHCSKVSLTSNIQAVTGGNCSPLPGTSLDALKVVKNGKKSKKNIILKGNVGYERPPEKLLKGDIESEKSPRQCLKNDGNKKSDSLKGHTCKKEKKIGRNKKSPTVVAPLENSSSSAFKTENGKYKKLDVSDMSTVSVSKNLQYGHPRKRLHVDVNTRCETSETLRTSLSEITKSKKRKLLENGGETSERGRKSKKHASFDITQLQHVLSQSQTGVLDAESKAKTDSIKKSKPKSSMNLREKMQEQLKSARFRYLNEKMYTSTGAASFQLFQEDEEAFNTYHEGFQNQVNRWPENPLDRIIQYVKNRAKKDVIADFGCGEARLASSVPHKVHSFDLVAANNTVTACDMAHVPLEANTVDVGVFCLSLMGTTLLEYLREAHRVLKLGGVLLIAEVRSRFEKISAFVRKLEKLGFILLEKDTTNKMFVWLEMKKAAGYDQEILPTIELQPCIYKKR